MPCLHLSHVRFKPCIALSTTARNRRRTKVMVATKMAAPTALLLAKPTTIPEKMAIARLDVDNSSLYSLQSTMAIV